MLIKNTPYHIGISECKNFRLHRHLEVEILYCIERNCHFCVAGKDYTINKGDTAVIMPMAAHEYFDSNDKKSLRIVIEVGPVLLGQYFKKFMNYEKDCIVIEHNKSDENCLKLYALLEECSVLYFKRPEFYNLLINGNINKVSALVLDLLQNKQAEDNIPGKKQDIMKIDKALEMLITGYSQQLTIELVSRECGYSKSNFCKMFKIITGNTFHNALNIRRVEIACTLLLNTDSNIEEIALTVGFSDSKSFCRVFKKIMNESPGNYRKDRI